MIQSTPATTPIATEKPAAAQQLTPIDPKELRSLKQRDREVRAHEQAHVAAGGQYVRGGASFSYQNGPDGHQYAVGGEVQIDTSPIAGDPAATLRKMQQVQRAALAPVEPSSQDRRVAAQAAAAAAKARSELQSKDAHNDIESKAVNAYRGVQSNGSDLGEFLNVSA